MKKHKKINKKSSLSRAALDTLVQGGPGQDARRAKKALGQNFLKSGPALRKIIEAGEVSEKDTVLEIGPGRGVLTNKLLEARAKVVAVEKDQDLVPFLEDKFAQEINSGKFILVEGDILKPESYHKLLPTNYKLIANIPYNITGAVLKKFLAEEKQPEKMVLLVQQEVAQRIVARDGKESILSISVKVYGKPKMIMKVPARYFSPAPKVDSAVIEISNISKDFFTKNKISEEKFWQIVRAGFAHKRKVLAGNLRDFDKEKDWKKALEQASLDVKTRAENLRLEDWANLLKNSQFN